VALTIGVDATISEGEGAALAGLSEDTLDMDTNSIFQSTVGASPELGESRAAKVNCQPKLGKPFRPKQRWPRKIWTN
jgi:hypothetical protein